MVLAEHVVTFALLARRANRLILHGALLDGCFADAALDVGASASPLRVSGKTIALHFYMNRLIIVDCSVW